MLPEARRTNLSDIATKRTHALVTVISTAHHWHKLFFVLNQKKKKKDILVVIKRKR
jgi:hypothetical protein